MTETITQNTESAIKEKEETWIPKIIAFLCNWCSYAGADLAGVSRIQYPPNIRIVRVPCSGRINPYYIIKSIQQGWDGVLISGCHPGDCHYISGNLVARRRFAVLNDILEFFGIEQGRINFSWVSAAEGQRFADVIKEVVKKVKKLGPNTKFAKGESNE
jgi:coenzyme F420-reducing hydrogenase delta subunit